MRHHTFFSTDELNRALSPLLYRYNAKVVKHLNASRDKLFQALDKPYLSTLPRNIYVYREFKLCKVHLDYHVQLQKCYYSVPYKLIGEEVELYYNTQSVEIYSNNTLCAVHPRLYHIGDASTLHEHMPSNHQYAEKKMNMDRLNCWAEQIGKYSLQFTQIVLKEELPPNAYHHIAAVLSMEKIYGKEKLETVIDFALVNHTLGTKSIRSILDKKLYLAQSTNNTASAVLTLQNNHANLRGKNNYQ